MSEVEFYYSCHKDESVDCCTSCHEDDEQGYISIHQDENTWYCCGVLRKYGVGKNRKLPNQAIRSASPIRESSNE